MANCAWTTGKSLPEVVNGHTFEMCNFAQREPHTAIFAGVTGLTFRNCNLINCDIPIDAIKISCNGGHVSYCSHEHPNWVDKGLAECVQSCTHLTGTDTIQVAGVTVATVYHYADKVVE
jgi:hypothetical protein